MASKTSKKTSKKKLYTFIIGFLCLTMFGSALLLIIRSHPHTTTRYNSQIYAQLEQYPDILDTLLIPMTSLFSQNQQIGGTTGDEEDVPLGDLKYVPDGHLAKVQQADGIVSVFITALNKTYLMKGKDLSDLSLVRDSAGNPLSVLEPQGDDFESSYAGFGSVIVDTDANTLLGIYHAEKRVNPDASDTQTANIALATSTDGGLRWNRQGEIITGMHEIPIGTKTSGAGDPCALIIGNYIYLYYVDWNDTYPNVIHLARAPLSSHGLPGSWKKYSNGGFTTDGLGGQSTPIIMPPVIHGQQTSYIANPSISYNTYFKKYLGIFETNIGFIAGLSEDGIHWYSFTEIFAFPKDTDIQKSIGDIWYSYPNYLSDATPTDMITRQSGYLYYSRGVFGQYHTMVRRSIKFK